jgi:hypothetical protein
MDIGGYIDPEKDKDGLKQSEFNRKIKAQKLKDMIRQGAAVVPL